MPGWSGAADSAYDPPSHAQGVKVTGAQTLLFIAGQVAFGADGSPAHGRDFAAQAREVLPFVGGPGRGGWGDTA